METRIKLDPFAYVLLVAVLAIQVYTAFLGPNVDAVISESDRTYKEAVFDSSENEGVLHQIFRQNEIDRELLKVVLKTCAR
jgi:hypothetical protein